MNSVILTNYRINSYISSLTNKIFSILPLYEEEGLTESLMNRLDNVIMKVDGFLSLIDCEDEIVFDIMSYLTKIKKAKNHAEVRTCVLKVCSTLSSMKVGD